MVNSGTLARRTIAGVLLFAFMFGPVWPISRWLAALMGIRWSGAPLIGRPHGGLFLFVFCLVLVGVGMLGRYAAIIVMGRFLSRTDVVPIICWGQPDPLQRVDDALLNRFFRS